MRWRDRRWHWVRFYDCKGESGYRRCFASGSKLVRPFCSTQPSSEVSTPSRPIHASSLDDKIAGPRVLAGSQDGGVQNLVVRAAAIQIQESHIDQNGCLQSSPSRHSLLNFHPTYSHTTTFSRTIWVPPVVLSRKFYLFAYAGIHSVSVTCTGLS
jgi:hypothetical protein